MVMPTGKEDEIIQSEDDLFQIYIIQRILELMGLPKCDTKAEAKSRINDALSDLPDACKKHCIDKLILIVI